MDILGPITKGNTNDPTMINSKFMVHHPTVGASNLA